MGKHARRLARLLGKPLQMRHLSRTGSPQQHGCVACRSEERRQEIAAWMLTPGTGETPLRTEGVVCKECGAAWLVTTFDNEGEVAVRFEVAGKRAGMPNTGSVH